MLLPNHHKNFSFHFVFRVFQVNFFGLPPHTRLLQFGLCVLPQPICRRDYIINSSVLYNSIYVPAISMPFLGLHLFHRNTLVFQKVSKEPALHFNGVPLSSPYFLCHCMPNFPYLTQGLFSICCNMRVFLARH